eukprot:GABV01002559.1.p1 GENE.GABV01002559.1~~GABV01002559.1.p1  ORF type:complete len:193 (+),score=69.01 GABV01002559.1:62-580(+)
MFARFIRLGYPALILNAQGRARPSIARLYSWRYKILRNLSHLTHAPEFQLANAGLACDFQLINVEDFQGQGETSPNPHYFQNLGEAEYIVQTYMYMRLLGYPAESISILTTYNGQKHLIRDILVRTMPSKPTFRPSSPKSPLLTNSKANKTITFFFHSFEPNTLATFAMCVV